MATYQLTGSNTTQDFTFGEDVILNISMPNNVAPVFSYSIQAPTTGNVPLAILTGPNGTIATIKGQAAFTDANVYIIEAYWSGKTTQLMYIHTTDPVSGRFQEWTFEMGGAPLPRNEFGINIAFWSPQLTGADIIRSGPLREGADINVNQLAGIMELDGFTFTGTLGDDGISGGYDDDALSGLGGDDILFGFDGDDVLRGGKQEDTLLGGNGDDKLFGQRNADQLNAGNGNDKLNGGGGNDTLNGDAGNDRLKGGSRDDLMNGSTGNDKLVGNAGDDTLNGGSGDDKLIGGGDNDRLSGGAGNDEMRGGMGADVFVFKDNQGADTITDFDTSEDVINLKGVDRFATFADLENAANRDGDNLMIDTGRNSDILLLNVALDDLSADNFQF